MSPLHRRCAAAFAAAGVMLFLAAPAAAAPDRASAVGPEAPRYEFSTPERSGFVYGHGIDRQVPPCTAVIFECDSTLVEVTAPARRLTFASHGVQTETFKDVDLHVYRSDATGAKGPLLGESNSQGLAERVEVTAGRATPGFYLVYLDWYFGRGAIKGTVTFTPTD